MIAMLSQASSLIVTAMMGRLNAVASQEPSYPLYGFLTKRGPWVNVIWIRIYIYIYIHIGTYTGAP